jgi:hypothetical protein
VNVASEGFRNERRTGKYPLAHILDKYVEVASR